MLSLLIALIVELVLFGVFWWAAKEIIGVIPMDGTIKNVILVVLRVVLLVVIAVMLLKFATTFLGVAVPMRL